jgi:hypothetical protein
MNPLLYQKAFHMLRRAGLAEKQFARLCRLRHTYQMGELDQPPLDQRWLLTTGRLTEQCPDIWENSSLSLSEHTVPARFLRDIVPFFSFRG